MATEPELDELEVLTALNGLCENQPEAARILVYTAALVGLGVGLEHATPESMKKLAPIMLKIVQAAPEEVRISSVEAMVEQGVDARRAVRMCRGKAKPEDKVKPEPKWTCPRCSARIVGTMCASCNLYPKRGRDIE